MLLIWEHYIYLLSFIYLLILLSLLCLLIQIFIFLIYQSCARGVARKLHFLLPHNSIMIYQYVIFISISSVLGFWFWVVELSNGTPIVLCLTDIFCRKTPLHYSLLFVLQRIREPQFLFVQTKNFFGFLKLFKTQE